MFGEYDRNILDAATNMFIDRKMFLQQVLQARLANTALVVTPGIFKSLSAH